MFAFVPRRQSFKQSELAERLGVQRWRRVYEVALLKGASARLLPSTSACHVHLPKHIKPTPRTHPQNPNPTLTRPSEVKTPWLGLTGGDEWNLPSKRADFVNPRGVDSLPSLSRESRATCPISPLTNPEPPAPPRFSDESRATCCPPLPSLTPHTCHCDTPRNDDPIACACATPLLTSTSTSTSTSMCMCMCMCMCDTGFSQ